MPLRIPQPLEVEPPLRAPSKRYALCQTSWNTFYHPDNLIRLASHWLLRNRFWVDQLFLQHLPKLFAFFCTILVASLEYRCVSFFLGYFLRFHFFFAAHCFFGYLDRRYASPLTSWIQTWLSMLHTASLLNGLWTLIGMGIMEVMGKGRRVFLLID